MKIVKNADILLPEKAKYENWAVVACDQFTSQPEYWEKTQAEAGGVSTYHLILPEIYLKQNDVEQRIENVNAAMCRYLSDGTFRTYENAAVLVERQTSAGIRLGLVLAVDLEAYDYQPGNDKAIKATEATVEERLPARVRIREGASLELPHTMLLLDDAQKSVIEPIYKKRDTLKKVYDFDLMQGGGHIRGYLVQDDTAADKINELCNQARKKGGFALAVGDGNHSLASAKKYYEKMKNKLSGKQLEVVRWCLVEIVNLHSEALRFEPIYRVVTGGEEQVKRALSGMKGNAKLKLYQKGQEFTVNAPENTIEAIAEVQKIIDAEGEKNKEIQCDYIHGAEHLLSIADKNGSLAVFLPAVDKKDLFAYVLKNGILPRKSFSMGEAEDKRYYIESKKIKYTENES